MIELHLDSAPAHLHRDQPGECEVSRATTAKFLRTTQWAA